MRGENEEETNRACVRLFSIIFNYLEIGQDKTRQDKSRQDKTKIALSIFGSSSLNR